MNRRRLMRFLGFAPAVPIVAALPAIAAPKADLVTSLELRLNEFDALMRDARFREMERNGRVLEIPSEYFDIHVRPIQGSARGRFEP